MSRPDTSDPVVIVALGIAFGCSFLGLAILLPALADAISIILKAFGAAAGIAVAVSTTGFATAGVFVTWLPQAATAGIATAGIGTTYLVLAKIVEKGKEKPYEWLLPVLGALVAFFVDLAKDQLVQTVIERAIYSISTALLIVCGGFLLLQKRMIVRAIGFVIPFLPTVIVCVTLFKEQQIPNTLTDFLAAGSLGAIGLIGVFLLGLLIAVLGVVIPNNE